MAYNFTVTSNSLVVTLDTESGKLEPQIYEYFEPNLVLGSDRVLLKEGSLLVHDFVFERFGDINGALGGNLVGCYELLDALIKSVFVTSGGGVFTLQQVLENDGNAYIIDLYNNELRANLSPEQIYFEQIIPDYDNNTLKRGGFISFLDGDLTLSHYFSTSIGFSFNKSELKLNDNGIGIFTNPIFNVTSYLRSDNLSSNRILQLPDENGTVATKEWFGLYNVLDYGAIADSITDNTIAFTSALNAVPDGGTLYVPQGIYKGNFIITRDNIKIVGSKSPNYDGANLVGGTIILGGFELQNSINIEIGHLGIDTRGITITDAIHGGSTSETTNLNYYIHDVVFLNNAYNSGTGVGSHGIVFQTGKFIKLEKVKGYFGGHGIAIRASNVDINDVFIQDMTIDSVILKAGITGSPQNCKDVNISNAILQASSNLYRATMTLEGVEIGYKVQRIKLNNINSIGGNQAGFLLVGSEVSEIQVNNFSVNSNGNNSDRGFYFEGGKNITLTNCSAKDIQGFSFWNNSAQKIYLNNCISENPAAGNVTGTFDFYQINGIQFPEVLKSYKVYTALLSQTGTSAPIATVLENTLGATITWSYQNTGNYIATANLPVFTNNKTPSFTSETFVGNINSLVINTTQMVLNTYGTTFMSENSLLTKTPIEIRVYN